MCNYDLYGYDFNGPGPSSESAIFGKAENLT